VILLLDIGNTRIKWAWLDGRTLRPGGAAVHAGDAERALVGWTSAARPDRVLAVSVAGDRITGAVSVWTRRWWGVDVRLLRSGAGAAVSSGYTDPMQLGADRWAAVVGAYTCSRTAVCVADCGSALTVDGVDADGRHRGGLIAPGWRLMRRALHQNTAQLPLVDPQAVRLFAVDTATAIASGTLLGLAAMVEQLTRRMAVELGGDVQLWLTGGDAPTLLPYLQLDFRHAPDLVLQGLAALAGDLP
jgi:type III pantothenate kinase